VSFIENCCHFIGYKETFGTISEQGGCANLGGKAKTRRKIGDYLDFELNLLDFR